MIRGRVSNLFGRVKFRTASFVVILGSILFLAVAQIFPPAQPHLGDLITLSIYAVLAVSWDVLSGLTGYLNFGIAFSFGVGGYVTALLSTTLRMNPVLAVILAGLGSVFFGLFVAIPSLRLRGHFFILVTLLIPLATASFMSYILDKTDGDIFQVNALVGSPTYLYNIAVAVFASSAIICYIVANSNIGLIFKSIRENEIAAEASGVYTGRYKIFAFSIASFFAGMAGAVYVFANTVASPTNFGILFSALPVFMAAVGGMGTIVGAVIGAFLLQGMAFLNTQEAIRLLIGAVLLIVVLLFYQGGIWGEARRRLKIF